MRIKRVQTTGQDGAVGYALWLSARETYAWANRAGARWPCSELAGHRIALCADENGLCDLAIDGRESYCDGTELEAIVSDHLPAECRHLWPTWEWRSA